MNKEEALKLLKSYDNGEISDDSVLRYSFKADILGKEITVEDLILNLATVKPVEDARVLYRSILEQTGNLTSIILVNAVDIDTLIRRHVESIKKLQIIPLYETQFPDDLKSFIKELNLPTSVLDNISLTILNIEKFLKGQGLEFDIKTGVFVDREYPDWREIEVVIGVNKDLKFIYENLKPTIYNIVSKTTTAVLLNKLMINFKTL